MLHHIIRIFTSAFYVLISSKYLVGKKNKGTSNLDQVWRKMSLVAFYFKKYPYILIFWCISTHG